MNKLFYVYVYLDPRKPGKFCYPNIETTFLFEPFYVGKGSGYRMNKHLNSVEVGSKYVFNSFKVAKIKNILKEGLRPYIIILKNDILEKDAFDLEKKTIADIGRKDLNQGPLCNFTDGGEGASGRKLTKKTKDKIRNKALGRKATESTKEKMRINNSGTGNPMYGKKGAFLGKNHTQESIDKMKFKKPDLGKKISSFYKENSKNRVNISGKLKKDNITIIQASEETGISYKNIFYGIKRKNLYEKEGFIFQKAS